MQCAISTFDRSALGEGSPVMVLSYAFGKVDDLIEELAIETQNAYD